jgi:hypothetical protein
MRLNALWNLPVLGLLVTCLIPAAQAQPVSPPVIPMPSQYADPARDAAMEPSAAANDESVRATAINLNYCRASFHRIRKYPNRQVLAEEQEKILNNLNLQGI